MRHCPAGRSVDRVRDRSGDRTNEIPRRSLSYSTRVRKARAPTVNHLTTTSFTSSLVWGSTPTRTSINQLGEVRQLEPQ